MKILLLGANGQLGRSFVKNDGLARYGEVVLATRDGLMDNATHVYAADLAEPAALFGLLERTQPDLILNAAAYTAVDRAEREEALATRINGQALDVIGRWGAANNALIMHYSTDYVFDGLKSTPYGVDDPTAPINAYGRSKLAGEHALRASQAPYLIFRTAWVYAAHGNNFLQSMLRLSNERPELRIVDDQFGTPTTTELIVQASIAAIDLWTRTPLAERTSLIGTYHLTSSGVTTWHDFARAIFSKAETAGLIAHPPTITAIGTKDYPTPAKRPAWSVLDNSSFRRRFGFTLPDWQSGLDEVINQLYVEAIGPIC